MLMALLCWNLYQGCFKLNCPEVEIILLLWDPFSTGKCQSCVIHRRQRRNTPAATFLRVLPWWLKHAHKYGTHCQMAKSFRYMRLSVNASLEMYLGMLGCWACVWWWMWNMDLKIPEALLLSPKMLAVSMSSLYLEFSMPLMCIVLVLDWLSDAHHMLCLKLHLKRFYFGEFKGKPSKHWLISISGYQRRMLASPPLHCIPKPADLRMQLFSEHTWTYGSLRGSLDLSIKQKNVCQGCASVLSPKVTKHVGVGEDKQVGPGNRR